MRSGLNYTSVPYDASTLYPYNNYTDAIVSNVEMKKQKRLHEQEKPDPMWGATQNLIETKSNKKSKI